jgi:hypothetical protein
MRLPAADLSAKVLTSVEALAKVGEYPRQGYSLASFTIYPACPPLEGAKPKN